jgi:ABC-2 type transport system permease protein
MVRSRYGVRAGWWFQTALLGWREYAANTPLRVTAMTLLPRAILQTVFVVLLADLTGGREPHRYAIVGATALTLTLSTMVGIADVPATDKGYGTFWRIRTGRLAPFTVFLLRSWPYPFIGVCTAVTTLLIVAPFDPAATVGHLSVLLPCFVLLALTTSSAGLAGAAFAVGRRADVLVGNLLAYLTMLCSGAVIPPGRNTWIDSIGSFFPMRHGLAAIHALEAGQRSTGQLAAEAMVGAAWFLIAWTLVAFQVRRARSSGHDDYA